MVNTCLGFYKEYLYCVIKLCITKLKIQIAKKWLKQIISFDEMKLKNATEFTMYTLETCKIIIKTLHLCKL